MRINNGTEWWLVIIVAKSVLSKQAVTAVVSTQW